jgi:hypothetical protein
MRHALAVPDFVTAASGDVEAMLLTGAESPGA